MTTIVYYVDSMPPEVCAAAMLSMCKDVVCVGDTAKSAAERTSFCPQESIKKVVLIGTYWKTELCLEELKSREGSMYVFRDDGTLSPIEFAEKLFVTDVIEEGDANPAMWRCKMAKAFHSRHTGTAPIDESQDVLNGLNYIESLSSFGTLFSKIRQHFLLSIRFDKIVECGQTITKYQKLVTAEQVAKNANIFNMKSGHKAIMSHVVLSVNLTHDALFKQCPDADATIVVTFNFKNNEIAVSVRSHVGAVSAVTLIRALPLESPQHGDGNYGAAGGRIPMTLKLNELF